jgi:hypothetical protein
MKFEGQLGTWLKQFETKDQTGKGTKIKGSNYNLSEGLDYKIVKTSEDQIRNIHFDRKTVPFQSVISSPFFNAVLEHYFITFL